MSSASARPAMRPKTAQMPSNFRSMRFSFGICFGGDDQSNTAYRNRFRDSWNRQELLFPLFPVSQSDTINPVCEANSHGANTDASQQTSRRGDGDRGVTLCIRRPGHRRSAVHWHWLRLFCFDDEQYAAAAAGAARFEADAPVL